MSKFKVGDEVELLTVHDWQTRYCPQLKEGLTVIVERADNISFAVRSSISGLIFFDYDQAELSELTKSPLWQALK